jgi:hypothetical protein
MLLLRSIRRNIEKSLEIIEKGKRIEGVCHIGHRRR